MALVQGSTSQLPGIISSCCHIKLSLLSHTEQLIFCLFTAAFIPGHTAHLQDKVWEQNMGPNSDLSHLLKQHNYYPTQSLLLTVESLPPSDHCVRKTTFDSEFHIILFWPSSFFLNKDFFFLFKQGIFFFFSRNALPVHCIMLYYFTQFPL